MLASLLTVKLYLPPPTPDLLARPRLQQRLQAGLRGRLTLISAPPGFGKTTLAASWLQTLPADPGRGIGWLSLDEGDNLPETFWTYFIAALQNAHAPGAPPSAPPVAPPVAPAAQPSGAPRLGAAALAAFQAQEGGPRRPPIESVLASLLNDLAALPTPQEPGSTRPGPGSTRPGPGSTRPGPGPALILALDDYHLITNPEINRALDFFIERLPPTLHLVLATRADPPLALARLRARGHLHELRAADLRFLPEEAGEFLNQALALDLAAEDVAALAERTEGWIAGLRLAAISLQNETDKHAFVGAFTASHRFLTDYLVDEVLTRLDPALQTFLQRTSILRRFNPALCDAVVGAAGYSGAVPAAPGSQAVLRRLEQANLFLAPLDSQRQWYRYHHLFAQFLRLRLIENEPALLPELYRRAIDWCAGHGLPREALGYALEAGDYPRAAGLVEQLAPQVLSTEGAAAVLQWLAALPGELVQQRPFLCVHYAWALAMDGQMQPAMAYLSRAEALADETGPPSGALRASTEQPALDGGQGQEPLANPTAQPPLDAGQRQELLAYIAAHRSYQLFFQGYFPAAIQYGQQALAQLPADAAALRVRTATFLSAALRQEGKFAAAAGVMAATEPLVLRTGSVYSANLYYDNLAELHLDLGQLHQAQALFRQVLAFSRQHAGREDIPFSGFAYFSLGALQHEWNALAAAGELMRKGLDLCREWRQADALAIGLIELAHLQQSLGAYAAARQALDETWQIVTGFASPWGMAMTAAHRARLDLAQGDLEAAGRWVQASGVSPQEPPAAERTLELHTLARVLIARGEFEPAVQLLDRLLPRWQEIGSVWRQLEGLVWQARALAGLGAQAQALRTLQQALDLGEPEGYIRTILDAGMPLVGLLRQLPPTAYRSRLLAAFAQEPTAGSETPLSPHPLQPSAGQVASAQLPAASTDVHPQGVPDRDRLPVEPLSERELAVLRLMAAGRSNQEIGAALYLSVNTVRWYASQIYRKLGVSGRGAAVAHARDLGVL